MITKYDDVVAVGRDGATFSSDQKPRWRGRARGAAEMHDFDGRGQPHAHDGRAEHTRYRKLVNRGFTPRQMRMLEPHIRELTRRSSTT